MLFACFMASFGLWQPVLSEQLEGTLLTAGLALTAWVRASFLTNYLGKATFFGGEEVLFRWMLCHLPSGSEN